jgi:hypothetical protein
MKPRVLQSATILSIVLSLFFIMVDALLSVALE